MPYITSIERMGREDGLKQGREEGRQEGQAIGRLEALRENILEVTEARFGAAPVAVRERINATGDVHLLKILHRLAVTCSSLREVEAVVQTNVRAP